MAERERERRRVNEWATITETTLTTTRISRGYKVRGEKPFHPFPFPPLSALATFICSERVAANNGRITMACLPWIEILVNFTHAHRVSSSVFGYWEHDDLDEARFSRTCYVTRGSLSISFFYFIYIYILFSLFRGWKLWVWNYFKFLPFEGNFIFEIHWSVSFYFLYIILSLFFSFFEFLFLEMKVKFF